MPTRSLSASDITKPGFQFFNSTNGHIYEYVSTLVTWSQALAAASAKSIAGVSGHLVTITSSTEQAFISSLNIQYDSVWIGASDQISEGIWKWVAGPEAGQQFWTGNNNGTSFGGQYSNWYLPSFDNIAGGGTTGADFGIINGSQSGGTSIVGKWDDASEWRARGYIVEYSNLVTTSFTLTSTTLQNNEGSTATFTLTTTNVTSGTSVPYTLSGITAADVSGGLLTGNAVVNASGVATISVALLNDALTEGNETLTVTAGGASASSVVNDTSKSPPTYLLTSGSTSFNEGTTATFTLTTTNVASGTSVPYTLSGITAADVSGGLLTGNAVVNASGVATISVALLNDALTEGNETLTVTAGGASASTVVNDTSKSPPTYLLTSGSASFNEGTTATFTLTTTNVTSGTSVPYTLSGISAADVFGGALSGNAVVNASGVATISVALLNDALTEGNETLTVTAGGASASTIVNDTSKTPTYLLTSGSTSFNEGTTATFTLTTTNVASGTSVPYTLSGITAADVSGGLLTGNAVVNASGVATISVALLNDALTEGNETLTVKAGSASASTIVNDTSKTPTYLLTSGSASFNEGTTATFTLTTTNVTSGTSVPYTLSGITAADVSGGLLTGNAVVNASGVATISVALLNDALTEGNETLTVKAGSASASTIVNDTSKTPTYLLTSGSASFNEGTTATFTLTTTNVASGTSVPYTLSGITAADVSGGLLTGNAVVNASGVATISVALLNDALTEGNETLTVKAGSASASTIVNDTSKTPTYLLTSGSASFNEGTTATFTLTTTNVTSGTSVPYTLSGITAADVSGGLLTGNAVVNASGVATISVALLNDALTEGNETLTVTAGGASASTVVNDTSKSPPTYLLTSGSTSFNEGTTATFTLTTTNVTSGTSVAYTLSGISAADVFGGALSGNAVVNASGVATISVALLNDALTEGNETLTVTAGGASASTIVNDTSKTPTYLLTSGSTSFNEGTTATFTLTTTNGTSGTSVPYTLSGITAADVSGGLLTGNAVVNASGVATISVALLNDALTEGNETLTVTAGGASASTVVNDTSKSPPTYLLTSGSASFNEGTTATFTLTTTNVTSGTSVAYTLSGISAADVFGGALSGNAVVNASGVATISVALLNDSLTEGSETLTVTAGGASASTIVNDTSKSLATYLLLPGNSSFNEGTTATFTLTTTNVTSGTSVPYTLSGISAADVTGGLLTGNAVVNASGVATISVALLNDSLTEGSETLTVTAGGASASTIVNDTSKSLATYLLSPGNSSFNEGTTATFTLTTTNVTSGTSVPYNLSGISASDVFGGALSGNAVVNASGVATISVALLNDSLTEGSETLTVTAGGASASTIVNDTSKSAPTYLLTTVGTSANEGTTATFTLTTTNVTSGTSVPYTLSGISAADVTGSLLTGNAVVNASGVATISVALLNDSLTEGPETLTVTAGGVSASTIVNDTSKSAPTYLLTTVGTSANEGTTATFTLTTTNVTSGTSVPYTLSGISAADVFGGALSGNAVVNASGVATISVALLNDSLTEGSETLTVTAGGATASTIVNDTSKSLATYLLTPGNSSFNEGTTATFTLTTSNVASGTAIPYTLSGISALDVFDGLLSGNAILNASGMATISVALVNDLLTEGNETLTVTALSASASTVINDTSKSTATYSLVAGSTSYSEGTTVTFTLTTSNVAAGTSVPYTLSGISTADVSGGGLSGNAVVNANGIATISVAILNDLVTEGDETLVVNAGGASSSTVIKDTSKSLATYSIAANSNAFNEGTTATFMLTTTNVASGTAVPYSFTGISVADISGGLLSGNAVVNANGVATISAALLNDLLTEGPETLTVSAGGDIASTVVNDTSKSPATYNLSVANNSVNEGSIATFYLTTTDLPPGTLIPFRFSGISNEDLSQGSLNGITTIDSNGKSTINAYISNDNSTEGLETLIVFIEGTSISINIYDTSVGVSTNISSIPYGNGYYYFSTSVSEKVVGTQFIDFIKQSTLFDSNLVSKQNDGSWQIQNKSLSSNVDTLIDIERIEFNDFNLALDINGSAGQVAKILGAVFGSSYIKNPTYVGLGLSYLDSGSGYTELAKLASDAAGLSSADLLVSTLWKNIVGNTATESIKAPYIKLLNEGMGVGELVVLAADSSINLQSINFTDLSKSGIKYTPTSAPVKVPTYKLSSNQTSVNEGSNATFTLTTTSVAAGTTVPYLVSGISENDLTNGLLTGTLTIGSNGTGTISIPIKADKLTEGTETLLVNVQGSTASTLIADTSVTNVPTYSLTAATTSVNEGELARVYLNTTNVEAGALLDFTVSGISSSDLIGGLSRQVSVDNLGNGYINLLTVADQLTEGPETMIISMGNSSVSIVINDTSTLVGIPVDGGGSGSGGSGGGGD